MSLLPGLTQTAPGAPLFAPVSGGGGGGVGPDPSFSTITINNGVLTTNSGANGFVFTNTTTPVLQDAFLQSNTVPLAGGTGTANTFQLNSISGSNNTLTIGAGNDNASYIWTGQGGSQDGSDALFIQAAGVFMSSLNVSSINGAAPGGGGAAQPNLQVSTLAVSSCMSVDGGSLKYFPVNDGTIQPPTFGFSVETSDGASLYTRQCSAGNLVDELKCVSTATGTFGLRTLVNAANAYVGYPSGPGGTDGGQSIYSFSTLTHSAPSTLSLAAPIVLASNLYMSNTTLTLTEPGQSNAGQLYFNSGQSNVYLTNPSTGTLCLGTQSNATALQVGNNFVSIPQVGTSISTLTVSSINGGALPTPGTTITNNAYPFTTGSDNAGIWQANVASNTSGSPQYLTASVTTNSSNSYLVCVNLLSGSNSDTATTSITKLALALSGAATDITLGSFPGFTDYWIYSGVVGPKTAIVRGASAIRLYAWATSPTQGSELYFDTATGMSITNLGPSS